MTFSQNNEQDFILDYFKDFRGAFLDIGANDGKTLSNSYALKELGWAGTLVEASPTAYGRLIQTYQGASGFEMFNFAIGSHDGKIVLHESGELLGTGDVALVSSTREDETQRWTSLNMPFTDVEVECHTFATFLSMSWRKTFDFLSIDIEGMEPEVVPQIDFSTLGVKMAIVEWNGKNAELYDGLLEKHGLKLIHTNAENRIYVKN